MVGDCAKSSHPEAVLLVGGDLYPAGRSRDFFQRGDAASILPDLREEFARADLTVVNLECPLIRESTPIRKIGPVFGAPEACVKGIKAAGIDLLNLANNHILDHGPGGLKNTFRVLGEAGLDYVGAGENLTRASRIFIREISGWRIAVAGIAEHEFSIASLSSPGACPLDLIDLSRNLADHRPEWDYLVVLLHGGDEGFPYPRPSLMKICRFLVEQGAGAVVCQHSHCPVAWEYYRGGHIIYGQGNLLLEAGGRDPSWYEGFLVRLRVGLSGPAGMELIPYTQSDGFAGVRLMMGAREECFRRSLAARSEALARPEEIERRWNAYCRSRAPILYGLLRGRTSLPWRLLRRAGFLSRLSRRRQLAALHLIRCESYREAVLNILAADGEESGSG